MKKFTFLFTLLITVSFAWAQLNWVGNSAARLSINGQEAGWYDCSTDWAPADFNGSTFSDIYSIKLGGECQSWDTNGDEAYLGFEFKNAGGEIQHSGTIPLPYFEPSGENDKWQKFVDLPEIIDFTALATSSTYYLHIWFYVVDNDAKLTIYDNNGGVNYVATVNTEEGKIWNGSVSAAWDEAGNWSGESLPETTENVLIRQGISYNAEIPDDGQVTVNNLTIADGASLTLKSSASGTGSLIINGTCTDEINVERFLSGGWDWHFLSSPVVDQPIVGAGNFIDFPNGIGDSDVDFYKHDETEAANPWINIKNEDGTLNGDFETTFEEKRGYLVAYNGADIVKTFTGVPYLEAVAYLPTYTVGGAQGWNFLGNPYQSAFEWAFGSNSFLGLESNYYYIYNEAANGGGGGYEYYQDFINPSSDNANGFIPAMQGFFVKTAEAAGLRMIVISPYAKAHNSQAFHKSELQTENLLKVKIQGESYFSKMQVYFNEESSVGADTFDAYMLFSLNAEVPHIYFYVDGKKLVANSVPFPTEGYSLSMGLKVGNSGTYTISAEDISNFNDGCVLILEDTETEAQINLRENPSYTFEVTETGINNSRFILHLKTSVGINEEDTSQKPAVSIASNQMQVYNLKSGEYEVRVMDIMGRVLLNESFSACSTITLPPAIKAGAYIVQISGEHGQWVEKVIIK